STSAAQRISSKGRILDAEVGIPEQRVVVRGHAIAPPVLSERFCRSRGNLNLVSCEVAVRWYDNDADRYGCPTVYALVRQISKALPQCVHRTNHLLSGNVVEQNAVFVSTNSVCVAACIYVSLDSAHELGENVAIDIRLTLFDVEILKLINVDVCSGDGQTTQRGCLP